MLFIAFFSVFIMFATFTFANLGWIDPVIPFMSEEKVVLDIISPLKDFSFSSDFGYRVHPITGEYKMHNGLDLSIDEGTPIYSIYDGVVLKSVADDEIAGNYIKIKHDEIGLISTYVHMQYLSIYNVGDVIHKGDVIGYVGSTGRSTGPHLHFSLQSLDMLYLNPNSYLDFKNPLNLPYYDYGGVVNNELYQISEILQENNLFDEEE